MVTKKSLKTKVTVSNQDKIKRSASNFTNKKAIFVSQKVIINSIFDKCFIEPDTSYSLPDHISDVFREMISDASHINETLNNKDYSYYDCSLSFHDAEKSISSKRKAIVEFMLKRAHELSKTAKRPLILQKKPRNSPKPRLKPSPPNSDIRVVPNDHQSDSNSLVRAVRKRKRPSKYHGVTEAPPERQRQRPDKESNPVIDLAAVDSSSDGGEPVRPNFPAPTKPLGTKVYFREPPGSTTPTPTTSATRKSLLTTVASSSSGSSTTGAQRRVKQHTLLDKVLLGVNCVRHATERGLHLSRLCEADLGLLNKRLASVDCVRLAELEEHTDDNNNRTLSVLLQAPGLLPVIATSNSSPGNSSSTSHAVESRDTPEPPSSSSVTPSSTPLSSGTGYSRPQKPPAKPHVPAMYRQRHSVPGILAKPTALVCDDHSRPDNGAVSTVVDHSPGGSDSAAPILAPPVPPTAPEAQMTASQLLKIRSQKTSLDNAAANQKRVQFVSDESTASSLATVSQLAPSPLTPSPSHYAISGGNGVRMTTLPVILVPQGKQLVSIPLIPGIHGNCNNNNIGNKRPISATMSPLLLQQSRTVTKIQRITPTPLQLSELRNSPLSANQHPTQSMLPSNGVNNIGNNYQRAPPAVASAAAAQSQSVILKNLLQQQQHHPSGSGNQHRNQQQYQQSYSGLLAPQPPLANRMVPLSVFQNSSKTPKRPLLPSPQQQQQFVSLPSLGAQRQHHSFHK